MQYNRAKRDTAAHDQDSTQPKKMDGLCYEPSKGYLPSENPKLDDSELNDEPLK